jgi:large subunit ribosomal protein L9
MKVIILKSKEVKEVSLGYAVNFLLPKKLAVVATKKKLSEIKKAEKEALEVKKQTGQDDRRIAEKIDGKVVILKVKAGKSGKIHGSISKKDIAKELKILKINIDLEKPIKKIGEHEIKLKFGKTKASIKLKIEIK